MLTHWVFMFGGVSHLFVPPCQVKKTAATMGASGTPMPFSFLCKGWAAILVSNPYSDDVPVFGLKRVLKLYGVDTTVMLYPLRFMKWTAKSYHPRFSKGSCGLGHQTFRSSCHWRNQRIAVATMMREAAQSRAE
jgi:hypothetical protein